MRIVVVLPAPFGPTRPKKHPRGTSRSTPATATFWSNRFHSPLTATAGHPAGARLGSGVSLVGQPLER